MSKGRDYDRHMSGLDNRLKNLKSYPRVNENEPCAQKPVQVRIAQSQYEMWMSLPTEVRNKILREAIANALKNKESLIAS